MSNNYLNIARSSHSVVAPYAVHCFLPGESFEIMISLNNCSSFCALISHFGSIAANKWGGVARHAYDISSFTMAKVRQFHASNKRALFDFCVNEMKNLFQFGAY